MAFDFKNEDDVKLYIENLGIEYRFSCYHEGNAEGCHLLGDYLEAIKKDFKKALTVYKSNCDNSNYGRSCHKYGSYKILGKGTEKDENVAHNYFEKGCSHGSAESCLFAGIMQLSSNCTHPDPLKGLQYLREGCVGNNAESCYRLSGLYLSGYGGIAKDMKKAHTYALQACQLGNVYSCANVSQMYQRGDGVQKDDGLAEQFKKMAKEMKEQHNKSFQQLKFGE